MRRSLITATVALTISLLGLTAAAEAVNTGPIPTTPKPGRYTGRDVQGHTLGFTFNGTQISHFSVGRVRIGSAQVTHGGWHVCHNTHCFNGSWTGSSQVHGSWSHAGANHHYGWHANLQHTSGGVTH